MQERSFTVGLVPGNGLVARFDDVVIYLGSEEGAGPLLAEVETAAQNPGAGIASRLAPIAFGSARTIPVGIVAPDGDGHVVLLHGDVGAEFPGGRRMSGHDGPAWVSETLAQQVSVVRISSTRAPSAPARRHTDLRAGVVPGGGFEFVRPIAVITAEQRTETVATVQIPSESRSPGRLRTPVETAAATTVVGVLSTEEGAVYPLDRNYVIGRSPLGDEAVVAATASPIVVDQDPYVSRVHTYVAVQPGGVFVRDAGTPAGTFIAAPGDDAWTQVGPVPMRLEPGWVLRVGEWMATHLAGNRR